MWPKTYGEKVGWPSDSHPSFCQPSSFHTGDRVGLMVLNDSFKKEYKINFNISF